MSVYPNAIDGYEQLPLVVDGVTPVNAFSVNTLREAILKIEQELGVLPSGSFNTLVDRLDSIDIGGSTILETILSDIEGLEAAVLELQAATELPTLSNIQYATLMEDPAGNLIFQRINQAMIEPLFETLTLSISSGSLIEVGDTLSNPAFTATYSGSPTSATIIDNQGNLASDIISSPSSFSYLHSYTKTSYNSSVIFTLNASDGLTSDNISATKRWVQKIFWGVGAAGGSSEAFIESLSNNALATSKSKTFTVTAGPTEKIYYAYRSGYGDATFTVGGFDGGFTKVSGTISVTNSFGFTENYTLYESDNLGLGTTTVVVS